MESKFKGVYTVFSCCKDIYFSRHRLKKLLVDLKNLDNLLAASSEIFIFKTLFFSYRCLLFIYFWGIKCYSNTDDETLTGKILSRRTEDKATINPRKRSLWNLGSFYFYFLIFFRGTLSFPSFLKFEAQ